MKHKKVIMTFVIILLIIAVQCAKADTEVSFGSTAGDGYMYSVDADYNTVWTKASGDSGPVVNDALSVCGQSFDGSNYAIFRGYLYFDTSSLSGKTIVSATLSLYGYQQALDGIANITIQNGQPEYPRIPLQTWDYNKSLYSGNGGSAIGWDTTEYYNITVNADGLTWINTTGTTKLAIRISGDIEGTPPELGNHRVVWFSNESSHPPILYVTYASEETTTTTTGTSTGDTMASVDRLTAVIILIAVVGAMFLLVFINRK